ncbi:hypothetical protein VTO42DRAFT_2776 [Malbranchea cinnamomea]
MGDALCGPSNALQNFHKHVSTDRALQQDRLASRSHPAQAFRSPHPNEGALDHEFASFETAFSPPLPEVHQQPVPFFPSMAQVPTPAPHGQPEAVGWAEDFKKLHIAELSLPASQSGLKAPFHYRPNVADWQNEFKHKTQQTARTLTTVPNAFGYGTGMNGMDFVRPNQFSTHHAVSQTIPTQSPQVAETFDESAFEAAFADARAEIELQDKAHDQPGDLETSPLSTEQTDKIGSDRIPAHQEGVNEADELAKTAGQLLESVSHDTSQKFKESNFLALMRQLRDREVTVDGDKFRQVSNPP